MGRPVYEEDLAQMGEPCFGEHTVQLEVGHEHILFGVWMRRVGALLSTL